MYHYISVLGDRAVTTALQAGYRHIDTAEMYGNEKGAARRSRKPASAGRT